MSDDGFVQEARSIVERGSRLQVLGPFVITFATAFGGVPIQDAFIPVPASPTLPPGTVVLGFWAFCTTDWDDGGRLRLGIATDEFNYVGVYISATSPQAVPGAGGENDRGMGNLVDTTSTVGAIVREPDTQLYCTTDAEAAVGETQVYALVAFP